MHDRILWILQWLVGVYFVIIGIMHLIVPEGLPGPLSWMYDLSDTLHLVTGVAEILGGLGLILPSLTRVLPGLTVVAAVGLLIVMIGAVIWHSGRGEIQNIAVNVVNAVVLAYIAYGRWRLAPITARSG
ncbi:MAG TPA: DoxX family protein [Acidimicrobiia bacterium]|nr:DoxX family protein [Acidimicrobiia bacterium]